MFKGTHLSKASGKFVAPIMMTPSFGLNLQVSRKKTIEKKRKEKKKNHNIRNRFGS